MVNKTENLEGILDSLKSNLQQKEWQQIARIRRLTEAYYGSVLVCCQHPGPFSRVLSYLFPNLRLNHCPEKSNDIKVLQTIIFQDAEHQQKHTQYPQPISIIPLIPPITIPKKNKASGEEPNHDLEIRMKSPVSFFNFLVDYLNRQESRFMDRLNGFIRVGQESIFSPPTIFPEYVRQEISRIIPSVAGIDPFFPYKPVWELGSAHSGSAQPIVMPELLGAFEQTLLDYIELVSLKPLITDLENYFSRDGEISANQKIIQKEKIFYDSLTLKGRNFSVSQPSFFDAGYSIIMKEVDSILRTGEIEKLERLIKIYNSLCFRTEHPRFLMMHQFALDSFVEERYYLEHFNAQPNKRREAALCIANKFAGNKSIRRPFTSYQHDTLRVKGNRMVGPGGQLFDTELRIKTTPSRSDSPLKREMRLIKHYKICQKQLRKVLSRTEKPGTRTRRTLSSIPHVFESSFGNPGHEENDYLILTYFHGIPVIADQLELEKKGDSVNLNKLRERVVSEIADFTAFDIYATVGCKDPEYNGEEHIQKFYVPGKRLSSKFIGDRESSAIYRHPFHGVLTEILELEGDTLINYRKRFFPAVLPILKIIDALPKGVYSDRSARNIIVQRNENGSIIRCSMTDFEYLRNANILFELATATETGLSSIETKVRSRNEREYFGVKIFDDGQEISWTEDNLLNFFDELQIALTDFNIKKPRLDSLLPKTFHDLFRDYLAVGTYVAMMHFSTSYYLYKHQTEEFRKINVYAMDQSLKTIIDYPLVLSDYVPQDDWKNRLKSLHSIMKEFYETGFCKLFPSEAVRVRT